MKDSARGRMFGRKLFITTLLCIVTFAVSSAAAAFKNVRIGDQALPVQLRDLEGQDHSLASNREAAAVLVLFWATWSERSLTELEDLKKLDLQYGDKGLRVLTINVENQSPGDEDRQKIRSILSEMEIDFPVLMDNGLKTYNEWGVIATPTTAIVDGNGTVVFDLSSYPTSGYLDVDEAIRKALGLYVEEETAVSAETTYKPARNAMLHFGLGKRHAEKGFMTKALPEFQKAAEADSQWADPRIYTGYLYLKKGQYEEAGSSLEQAEDLEQGREEVLLLRGYLLLQEQKVDEALALLQSNEFGAPMTDSKSTSADSEPDGTARPAGAQMPEVKPADVHGLTDVRTLVEEGRLEEASKQFEEILSNRLDELGFIMKKKKNLSAMEKMKLMMEKKQERQ